MKKRFATLATVLLLSGTVQADVETSFTYGGIYKSLKTAQSSEFSQLSLNFVLLENTTKTLCPTSDVYLSDGENRYDISMSDDGELLIPLDKKLKKDRATITLKTPKANMCHLSMQIEVAEFELENTSSRNVKSWVKQLNGLYETLAGWPGKYFMPELTGLVLEFEANGTSAVYRSVTGDQTFKVDSDGKLNLSVDTINALDTSGKFVFSQSVVAAKPILEK
ncbi:DUF2987 domain-containing protein [Psychrobium sp. 1_MG-2023]|uniref:DUF2987 domain-containing protein n=1 Tax=Psychrobium sp. 1_MG-2023 TaxID=3062624 RepID=UPI000C323644|nr:DUF2987 domain-containing protein [Psychrobium sp. 1_MG-2023]MDP2561540.1 DUF2987 domain-containing protein [Psychrobium sp. 1_MG-2023]PKF55003.1 hypothetical protein CW748_14585 [Alteromonadales bacterium alter-6D02]